MHFRRRHPSFGRRSFFRGAPLDGAEAKDLVWYRPDGQEMNPDDWNDGNARCIGMFMSGRGIADVGTRGEALEDDDFFLLFNAHHEHLDFVLPVDGGGRWQVVLDTTHDALTEAHPPLDAPSLTLHCRSLVLLSRPLQKTP